VKMSVIQFIVSFLVSGDNIVIRQLMDTKGCCWCYAMQLCIS